MRIKRSLSFILPLALLMSCQQELSGPMDQDPSSGSAVLTKVINSPENADPSSIMIFMNAAPTSALIDSWAESGIKEVHKLFTSHPGHEEREARFNLDKWYRVSLENGMNVETAARIMAVEPSVRKIQYNTKADLGPQVKCVEWQPCYQPQADRSLPFNDPMLKDQWHYINIGDKSVSPQAVEGADINVKDVWKLVAGDPKLVVAIVDEGVMYSHPDLAPNMWKNPGEIAGNQIDDDKNGFIDDVYGYNFAVRSAEITWDGKYDLGHGTHVAGTVAAVNNNHTGVSGVAGGSGKNDGVKMMSCQIFSNGGGYDDAIANAFKYAGDNGACILQCSFGINGGFFVSDNEYIKEHGAEIDALNYFKSFNNYPSIKGGLAIFASGNEEYPMAGYPGALKDNISVSAFGPDFLPANYTNYGPGCNITAPGGDDVTGFGTSEAAISRAMVLSTIPNQKNKKEATYGYMQGTSMACPHASGVAALGLIYANKLGKVYTAEEYTDMFLSSTNEFDSRLTGQKTSALLPGWSMNLSDYHKQMGTGSLDAWRFLMQIEGIPSVIIKTNSREVLSLSKFFGTSAVNLTYLGVDVSEEAKASLGIIKDPEIKFGKLYLEATKPGAGKVTVRAIAGGDHLGGGNAIGGQEIKQEISIIARSFKSSNGGWL